MAEIRIGTSGWHYQHWKGTFYPADLPASKMLAFYMRHFDAVEINNSFYRLPKPETFTAWRDQAPPGFCYAVKANRFLTQAKKLKDCEDPMARMMASFDALRPGLGPILYQLPPRFHCNLERLESFLQLIPREILLDPLGDDEEHAEALGLLRASPALGVARSRLRGCVDEARAVAQELPAGSAREALVGLADYVAARTG